MSIQSVNPNKNIKSHDEMIDEIVDEASQMSNQQKRRAASQDKPNQTNEDIEVQESEPTFQRKPQFRLNENNRRRF